ncbi:MAG: hypothetical protein QM504_13200 [Pseudomonadota bacterium]
MKTIDDKKEQLSSCIDGELEQQQVELLIDSLLENSSQGEQLRYEWQHLHLISTTSYTDASEKPDITPTQANEIPLIDVSAQISRQIEDEVINSSSFNTSKLIKPGITSIPNSFGFFKTFLTGSAIAASLVLVVVNVINSDSKLLDKTSVTTAQTIKTQQMTNVVTSKLVVANKMQHTNFQNPELKNARLQNTQLKMAKNNTLARNYSTLLNNNLISPGKLYRLVPQQNSQINYINSPVVNSKYSNLFHKVSLTPKQNNKNK